MMGLFCSAANSISGWTLYVICMNQDLVYTGPWSGVVDIYIYVMLFYACIDLRVNNIFLSFHQLEVTQVIVFLKYWNTLVKLKVTSEIYEQ